MRWFRIPSCLGNSNWKLGVRVEGNSLLSLPLRTFIDIKSYSHTHSLLEPPCDKTNKMTVRPAKTQISLGIRPVWSESSLSAWRKLGFLATHWVHSKTLIRLGGGPGWSKSSLCTQSFCWFCQEVAHLIYSYWHKQCSNLWTSTMQSSALPLHLSFICVIKEIWHPTKWEKNSVHLGVGLAQITIS